MKFKLLVSALVAAMLITTACQATAGGLNVSIGIPAVTYVGDGVVVSAGGYYGHRSHYRHGYYNNGYPIDPYRGQVVYAAPQVIYQQAPQVVYQQAPQVVYEQAPSTTAQIVAELQAQCRPGIEKIQSGNVTVFCAK